MERKPGGESHSASIMKALKSVYPISISANLTRGEYRALDCGEGFARLYGEQGRLDELVALSAERVLPAYAQTYTEKFGAASLMRTFAAGADSEQYTYRQHCADGNVHWLECVALHVKDSPAGDVTSLILIRNIDEQKTEEDALQQALEATSGELTRERWYQELLDDYLPIGTVLFRLDAEGEGTLLHVGGTMLASLGYTVEEYEAFQRDLLKGFVYEPDYATAFSDRRMLTGALPAQFEQEFRVVKKDGSLVWMYEKGSLVRIDDAPAYIIVCVDITRRKEIEERLRVSEEEMSVAMSQMGKMVCLFDVAARTLTLPEEYAEKHGLPAVLTHMPENADALPVMDEQGKEAFRAFYEAILRGDKSGTVEGRLMHADGEPRWERAEFVTIFDSENRPVKAIIAVEDVTQRHLQDDETEALRENERVFRTVAAHSNRLIYRYDIAAKTAYADPDSARSANAMAAGENMPESIIERGDVLPESVADYRRLYRDIEAGKPEGSAKVHMRDLCGKLRWIDMRYSLIDGGEKTPTTAVISMQDITMEHERELAYERYRQMIEEETDSERLVYFETDLTTDVVEKQGGNIPFIAFPENGCRHEEAVAYGIEQLLAPEERTKAWEVFSRNRLLAAFANGTRSLELDLPAVMPDGERCWFHAEIQMIEDPYSGHIKIYTTLRDVTAEISAALDVKKQAETDGMTGLYNKATTEAMVKRILDAPGGGPCALLIADLDNLKSINDNLGHAQGDRAIRSMADTLQAQFRRTDIIGRIGGDEFLAFLDGAGNEKMLRGALTTLMRRLATVRIGEKNNVALRASIGVACGMVGKDDFDALYRRADLALYQVKRNGKNDFAFYKPEMEQTAYRYESNNEAQVWRADNFELQELDRLLHAVSELYPMVISVNLTQNSYYMMQYNHYMTKSCYDAGVFDELIAEGASTFHPEDRATFLASFGRERLLAAHARGKKSVTHIGRQLGDDGVYRRIRTDVIFSQQGDGDVMELTFAREVPDEKGGDGE